MAAGGGSVGHVGHGLVRRDHQRGDMASILLKPGDVAERLSLKPCTVLRMIQCGELPAICVRQGRRKKTFRIYEQALEKWLKSKTVTTATRPSRKPSFGPHTNGRESLTEVLPQNGKPMEVIEKSSGELDTPSGSRCFQGVNDGR